MIKKTNKAVIEANKKGYIIKDGNVFYKNNPVKAGLKNSGYYGFSIRTSDGKRSEVMVHRLVAYQKYGKKIFKKGIHVRHLDTNPLNNLDCNISIGSQSDNMMDKPKELRLKVAINASNHIKKHNHDEIISLHNQGFSYKQIMEKLGIKSKGTISFIIKKEYRI